MRKLIYVGKDKFDTIIKTTNYKEMLKFKEKGFTFKEVMEEVKENKEPNYNRIAKVKEKMGLK